MLEAEITIERSSTTVWKYFTNPRHWEKWWGGGMKSAQWRKGGKLVWVLGGMSEVLDIIPGEGVIISGYWMDFKWEFRASGQNSTIVSIESSTPRKGAFFTDGGASHLVEMKQSLMRLKECIERETEQ